jgi:hypothetical protein
MANTQPVSLKTIFQTYGLIDKNGNVTLAGRQFLQSLWEKTGGINTNTVEDITTNVSVTQTLSSVPGGSAQQTEDLHNEMQGFYMAVAANALAGAAMETAIKALEEEIGQSQILGYYCMGF